MDVWPWDIFSLEHETDTDQESNIPDEEDLNLDMERGIYDYSSSRRDET